jgi:hypothetical protein
VIPPGEDGLVIHNSPIKKEKFNGMTFAFCVVR